jgi:hypothetical protein
MAMLDVKYRLRVLNSEEKQWNVAKVSHYCGIR